MFFLRLVFFLVLTVFESSFGAPQNLVKLQSMPEYVKFLEEFKKLQSIKTTDEMKSIASLGLVSGALQVQKGMRENLSKMVVELLDNIDMKNSEKTMPKIDKIDRTIERDEFAISALGNALDLARKELTIDEFRSRAKRMLREYNFEKHNPVMKNTNETIRKRLEKLKSSIVSHMEMMKRMIKEKSNATILYLEEKHGVIRSERKIEMEEHTTESAVVEITPVPIFSEPIEDNIIEDVRRQDVNVMPPPPPALPPPVPGPETEGERPFSIEVSVGGSNEMGAPPPPPGGPLIGIIASLSGGEEGSDVSALVGALTGVIMNLFGPGGLDVPTILSGGSALLAGLLSGGRDFGVVLGEYVGLAVDGFSGGGGAINNGRFFGNLVGTVIAELSSDPEDDDLPPKPQIFIQNFLNSFSRATSKAGDESPEEATGGGSTNSFGFITQILRAIVGGVTNFILNASLGSVGGLSKGSSSSSSESRSSGKHSWG